MIEQDLVEAECRLRVTIAYTIPRRDHRDQRYPEPIPTPVSSSSLRRCRHLHPPPLPPPRHFVVVVVVNLIPSS